jgi:hypothetical protein
MRSADVACVPGPHTPLSSVANLYPPFAPPPEWVAPARGTDRAQLHHLT